MKAKATRSQQAGARRLRGGRGWLALLGVSAALLVSASALSGVPAGLWGRDAAPAPEASQPRRQKLPLETPVYGAVELDALGRRLDRALDALGGKARISAVAFDAASGQLLFARDADHALVPASTMKVLTGAAAYDLLGPDHELVTRFAARGTLRDGVLSGDLMVRGAGDPTVSGRFHDGDPMAAMGEIADALAAAGLRRVEGDLLAWGSPFSGPRRGPNWPKDAYLNWWMVDVVALPFNDNQITIRCLPKGGAAELAFAPDVGHGRLENALGTTPDRESHRIVVTRGDRDSDFRVSGQLWSKGPGYDQDVNVGDGTLYFLDALGAALAARGVETTGRRGRAEADPDPRTLRVLHERRTPLRAVVPTMLQRSQNLYAELLLRILGAERGGEGSFEGGAGALRAWLDEAGILESGTVIADGSGLSRDNRLGARQLAEVLVQVWRMPDLREDLVAALAAPGRPGTLASRMKDLEGRVFAKTGTLSGMSALAGYARASDGRMLAFAMIANGCVVAQARRSQDRICAALCAFGGDDETGAR